MSSRYNFHHEIATTCAYVRCTCVYVRDVRLERKNVRGKHHCFEELGCQELISSRYYVAIIEILWVWSKFSQIHDHLCEKNRVPEIIFPQISWLMRFVTIQKRPPGRPWTRISVPTSQKYKIWTRLTRAYRWCLCRVTQNGELEDWNLQICDVRFENARRARRDECF